MAEPRPKAAHCKSTLPIRLIACSSPNSRGYDILVPRRERPVGGRVKEFDDDEDDGNLRAVSSEQQREENTIASQTGR